MINLNQKEQTALANVECFETKVQEMEGKLSQLETNLKVNTSLLHFSLNLSFTSLLIFIP